VVPHQQRAAGLRHAAHLGDRRAHDGGIDEVVEHGERHHEVERAVLVRERVGAGERDVEPALARAVEHAAGDVDADLLVVAGQRVEQRAGAAADVEHAAGRRERARERDAPAREVRHHVRGDRVLVLVRDVVEVVGLGRPAVLGLQHAGDRSLTVAVPIVVTLG
jgi:hypothetical protein